MIDKNILMKYYQMCIENKKMIHDPNFLVIPVFDIDDSIVYPSPYQNMPLQTDENIINIAKSRGFQEKLEHAYLAPWVHNPNYKLFSLFDHRPKCYVTGRHEFQLRITIDYLKNRNLYDELKDCIIFLNFMNLEEYHLKKTNQLKEIITLINHFQLKACIVEDSVSIFQLLIMDKEFVKNASFSYHLIYQGLPVSKFETYAYGRDMQ